MISEERRKDLKSIRASLNKRIRSLAEQREVMADLQRDYRVRTWRIKEILDGDIEDE